MRSIKKQREEERHVFVVLGSLTAVLLELPVTVVERAHLTGLEPARNAMEVECVLVKDLVKILRIICRPSRGKTYVAYTPGDSALFTGSGRLVRLTFYT